MRASSRCLHCGYRPVGPEASRAVPLHQSVAHLFENSKQAARRFDGEEEGPIYSRINNPTVDVFEKRIAALEAPHQSKHGAGYAGLAASSGMAAIFLLAVHFAKAGDEIVSSDRVYGGTFHLFHDTLPRLGIKVRFVKNPHSLPSWQDAISRKTKLLFVETPSNPKCELFDIAALADIAKKRKISLAVDSTIATPILQQPLLSGADVVVHSATKYICGNGTALGGALVGRKDLMDAIRARELRDIGASLSPFNAWLFVQGIETLPLRMPAHSRNAVEVAEFLAQHPKVSKVHYAGLKDSPYFSLVERQMGGQASSLMAFELRGGRGAGAKFIESLRLISHVANLGDNKTLAIHPASTTHHQLPTRDLQKLGITPSMVRMSVGLEDTDDIIKDIKQALRKL